MLMPSIFGESLFDDFFNDFTRPVKNVARVSNSAPAVMRTDVRESDTGYELDIDLPGYKTEDVQAQLKDGYLTITATTKTNDDQKDENGRYIKGKNITSFVSAFPISDPKYALMVIIDSPKATKETYGFVTSGWNAVPTGGKIITRIAPQLNVRPNFDIETQQQKVLKNYGIKP